MSIKLNLPAYTSDDDIELVVPTSLSLINARNVEPIGFWYHLSRAVSHDISSGLFFGKKEGAAKKEDSDDEDRDGISRGGQKKFVKLSEEDLATDWYDLLKLETGDNATENEIRNAYRRRCLETHPDKQPDHSDELFKRVQRAFEILGEPNGRRAYDSSRPFDDTIPDEDVTMDEETFFKVYRPAFDRNRKWSVDNKIPKLGDENSCLKEVHRFYDCWYRFNSWRDFSHVKGLEDIDEKMCREEKRYYLRENQRVMDRYKRTEQKRIRTLVEQAQKIDPRLRKAREAEEYAREKERLDRNAEKERIRTEEILRKAAIVDAAKAEEKARQDKVVNEKVRIKECEAEVIAFLKTNNLIEDIDTNMLKDYGVRPPNIKFLFTGVVTADHAEHLLETIQAESVVPAENKSVPAVLKFNELVLAREQEVGKTRYGEATKKLPLDVIAARRQAESDKRAARSA